MSSFGATDWPSLQIALERFAEEATQAIMDCAAAIRELRVEVQAATALAREAKQDAEAARDIAYDLRDQVGEAQ